MRAGTIEPKPASEDEKHLLSFERCETPIGHVAFLPASEASGDGAFGAEPDAYVVALIVPEADFESMVARVLAGQSPHSLQLNVPDFKYGWAPDGSNQTWDLVEHPYARTDSATFVFGWDMRAEEPEQEDELPSFKPPAPVASPEARLLSTLTEQITRYGNYVLLLLAALFALLAARLW